MQENIEIFKYLKKSDNLPENQHFVYVGRLDENKGIKFLISTWVEYDFGTLYIYGEGNLSDYVKENMIPQKIVYCGFCTRGEIAKNVQSAAAMIFPSQWYEGFPMTIIESFSYGTPVVSCGVGNQDNIIKNSINGYKYIMFNQESFANAIKLVILSGTGLRKSTYKNYIQNYADKDNYTQLIKLYDNITKM